MQVLRKNVALWEALARILDWVVKRLQFAIIFPVALSLILSYPFLQSIPLQSRPRILTHQTNVDVNASVAHIRQAVVVPPVFLSALDPKMLDLVAPMKQLSDSLDENSTFPVLFSMFNPKTAPISMYVSPHSKNVQGLLFTYVYTDVVDEKRWLDAISRMSAGEQPTAISNIVDRAELREAEIATASSPSYSLWPGTSDTFTFLFAAYLVLVPVMSFVNCLYTGKFDLPTYLLFATIVRILAVIFVSISITSVFFTQYDVKLFFRFLIVPVSLALVSLTCSYNLLAVASKTRGATAFNRLANSYTKSFGSQRNTLFGLLLLTVGYLVLHLTNSSPSLRPLTFVLMIGLVVDTFMHYLYFAAVLYIDMLRFEAHDFVALEDDESVKIGGNTDRFGLWDAVAWFANMKPVKYLTVLFYKYQAGLWGSFAAFLLICGAGSYSLNRVHPHLAHSLGPPEYIDMFIDPKDDFLNRFDFLEVFTPAIMAVDGRFNKPHVKTSFTFSTLRYGNTISVMLETFCLLIFFTSLCMIAIELIVDPKQLDFTAYLTRDSERFSERTIDVSSKFDILLLVTEGLWIATWSLQSRLCLVDFSSIYGTDSENISRYIVDPALFAWGVSKLQINPLNMHVALFGQNCIELWDMRVEQRVFVFKHPEALACPPLMSRFCGATLIVVTPFGRAIELYPSGRTPDVIRISTKNLRWAVDMTSPRTSVNVLVCTADDKLLLLKRDNHSSAWVVTKMRLSEGLFLHSSARDLVEDAEDRGNVPSSHGMLQHPIPWTRAFTGADRFMHAIPLPDIHMTLIISDQRMMLLDVTAGVFIYYTAISNYKPGTLQVFHSQPTHCAFCGCAAIASLSIAYESADREGLLVCDTFRIVNRSRNNICLRVERDPRETRCLGFNHVRKTTNYVDGVERWTFTGINTIMGVRRKIEEPNNITGFMGTSQFLRGHGLSLRSSPECEESSWEGFAMSASGRKTFFSFGEDPLNHCNSLLIGELGPIAKIGEKSVCVGFGNVIKVLSLTSQ